MKNKNNTINIGVFGLWHLGSVYAAGLAKLGFRVTAFDSDVSTISNFERNIPPIFEPTLDKIISEHNKKNLNFTTDPSNALKNKKYVFITQDVQINNQDQVQMDPFWKLVETVARNVSPKTKIIVSSQVPVTTCKQIQKHLSNFGKKNIVMYMPENLRLGNALDNFLRPDRVVIGCDSDKAMQEFAKDFKDFECDFLTMSLESAEMSKHAMNAYLALNISFSSELGDICEKVGADLRDIVLALKSDKRVSPKAPINPGMGFSGGTLGRDLESLKFVSKLNSYKPRLIESISRVNYERIPKLIDKVVKAVKKMEGANIGILGLTYKPNTNTLRRSQSIILARKLGKLGANIKALDYHVEQSTLPKKILLDNNPDTFFKDIDAVILMTEWPVFLDLITKDRLEMMRKKTVIDAKNFLDGVTIKEMGGSYLSVGYQL